MRLDAQEISKSASSPLSCPRCAKAIPLLGRDEVIRHPFAQRLQNASFAITGWWLLIIVAGLIFVCMLGGDEPFSRGMGWMLMFLPALPGFSIFFIVKCFPRYRVTRCPFCRFEEMERLKKSHKLGKAPAS